MLGKLHVMLLLTAFVLSSTGCQEQFESHYLTIEDARQKGAISRGWIPEALPKSSSDIHEKHDVDTNEVWGAFAFNPDDVIEGGGFVQVPNGEIVRQRARSPHANWWPPFLNAGADSDALSKADLSYYRSDARGVFFMALRKSQGRGYFWCIQK